MGSNSNRSETRSESLNRLSSTIRNQKNISDSKFQTTTGAEIRGKLGVEKGNQFISDMKKYK
jgi:hypothetical protein